MKKRTKLFSLVLALILALSTLAILPASAENATATGWDGSQSLQPMGSGTEEDPYLIATAANLKWLRDSMPAADASKYQPSGANYGEKESLGLLYGVYEGKFFKQIADIDLNGKTLNSIGFYTNFVADSEGNDRRINAFGGTYDGNGYSIKNGTISASNTGHGLNTNWGNGLFGVIYGATIKNLTLDGLTVNGWGITGALVGISLHNSSAVAGSRDDKINTITNCHVKNTTVNVKNPGKDTKSEEWVASGAMVGYAFGCNISYCTCDADITAPGNYRRLGGIAGLAGADTVIDHCVFTGSLTLDVATLANSQESGYGGIVGSVMPSGIGSANLSTKGTLKVTNCYNSGTFTVNGTATAGIAICWGGIVGSTNQLIYVTGDSAETPAYIIENCYNLWAATWDLLNLTADGNNRRVGGILGSSWHFANKTNSTMWIKDCTSVTVPAAAYEGTNEYRYQTNKTNAATGERYPATVISGVPNVERTTEAIGVETAKIDAAIAAAALPASTVLETATKPVGDGTANAPYIVESAANLVWLREQVANGTEDASAYYIQIADIDLNGRTIYPIGESTAKPFKGVYDGKGYSIKNGIITTRTQNHAFDLNTATGLFGVIAGATVRGIILDKVTVEGYGATGGIVGYAWANLTGVGTAGYNKIQNCKVTHSCLIHAFVPVGSETYGGDYNGNGRAGGIVGTAHATVVDACVNEANVIVPAQFNLAGGIGGVVGFGAAITNCTNSGNILYDASKYKVSSELGFGGIVGFIAPYGPDAAAKGSVSIQNCVNSGALFTTGTKGSSLYFGGILGGANTLTAGATYTIDHCYNTNTTNYLSATGSDYRVGGLVGSYWLGNGNNCETLNIANSYSVTMNGSTTGYKGNNEYRAQFNNKPSSGKVCIQIGLSDDTFTDAPTSATYPANATVGTKTASEMADAIAAVNSAITSAQTAAYHGSALISYKGYQSTAPADGKVDLRLVFGVDVPENELENYSRIHVYAIGSSNYESLETTKVYTSIQGTKADNSPVTYTASEFGTEYLAALKVAGVPTTGTYTLKLVGIISSRTVGDSYEVSTITVTITNGAA